MNPNTRRHPRNDIISIIEYVVEPSAQESFDGVVANISESGFCLFTTYPLDKNDTITIKKKKLSISDAATVRWIDRSNKYYCKAGLEFTSLHEKGL
jgi:hypothetical protein